LQNRRYSLTISDLRPFRPYLEVDVISTIYPTEMRICSIPLTQLASHEIGLQDGRFLNFSTHTQDHLVGYWIAADQNLEQDFTTKLTWIDQNVKADWYFEMSMIHIGQIRMIWSFIDVNEAMLFKLSF